MIRSVRLELCLRWHRASGAFEARPGADRVVGSARNVDVDVWSVVEAAEGVAWVRGRPVLEAGERQTCRDVVDALVAQLGRGCEDTDDADDREADATMGTDDRESRGYPRQVQREPRPTGHDEVPEHALGEVDRPGGAADDGGDDEAEDVHDASHEAREDVVAAGRTVGLGSDRVERSGGPTRKIVGMPMFTTRRAIMRPRRLRSSMILVAIIAPLGTHDPR